MPDVRAVLLEDDPDDRELARRLSESGLETVALQPPTHLEDVDTSVAEAMGKDVKPLILMDYRLDDVVQEDGSRATYRGGTAAAHIREELPAIPLVLITTESRWHRWVEGSPSLRGLFDFTVMKDEVATRLQREDVAAQLRSIAEGYWQIAQSDPDGELSWEELAELLGGVETATLREELSAASLPSSRPAMAEWLLNTVLDLPGVVVGPGDAAAILGVEKKTFLREPVSRFVESARYRGVYSSVRPRWWRKTLLSMAREIAGQGRSGEVAEGLAQAVGSDLRTVRRARCVWCEEADVDRACFVCGELVGQSHLVPLEGSGRPGWAMPAVLCFSCIESGRGDDQPIAHLYRRVADRVRSGEA